jgi:putative sugar O-methyltransferase
MSRSEADQIPQKHIDAGLPNVAAMVAELRKAPPIVQPSALWEELNRRNVEQLERDGFSEFKRTVNCNYFQFIPPSTRGSEQFRAVMRDLILHPRPSVLTASFIDSFDIPALAGQRGQRLRTRSYAAYVAALWEYARRRDSRGLLERLEEPSLGHPVAIRHRGRRISEDLSNSMLELTAMLDGMGRDRMFPGTRMIELGAGYGRLTWAFLASFPGIRCVIVDIPPALAVSERYLTELFPDRPAFRFRPFEDHRAVWSEFERAEIAFLTPNQLGLLPILDADLFATVSSLHEMRPAQIKHYIDEAGHHCPGGFFYTKQWQSWWNPTDDVTIRQQEYPIPTGWRTIFEHQHPVQALFFEAMYEISKSTRA